MSKVSILLPVYNAASFLEECLNSILSQSIENWELLAVNNDSKDNSLAILKHYATKDSRIRVLENQPNSIITALRKALAASTGQWITRMDADDRMAPQKLESLRENLEQSGKGHLAVGLVEYFSEKKLGEGYQQYAIWLNELSKEGRNFEDRYKECVIPSPCWMCSRADLIHCGAFDADRYPEDYDLAFRFYEGGLKIVGVPEVLHYWRDYASRSSRTSAHYSDNRFLELKVDYFHKLDFDNNRPLVLWGAGKKGKRIAQLFIKKGLKFYWLTNNESKIGHHIYDITIHRFSFLKELKNPQLIVSVAAPDGQLEIKNYLSQLGHNKESIFWFC